MRFSIITTGLFVATAVASPILRARTLITDIVVVTETVYVTAGHLPTETSTSTTTITTSTTSTPPPPPPPPPTTTSTPEAIVYVTTLPPASTTPAEIYQAPQPTEAPPPPPVQTPTVVAGNSYQDSCVNSHNVHRANHSAPGLQWDDGLASIAAEIASSCVYAHNTAAGGGGYGQNIAAGITGDQVSHVISDLFYNNEVNYYPQYGVPNPDMSNFHMWGHFSQIVWKSTTAVGCATQYCPGGLANAGGDIPPYFTVCNYKSPGNFGGEYGDNVLPPLGQATVSG